MTDYKTLAERVARQKQETVRALQPIKLAARARRAELMDARHNNQAVQSLQTQERELLDMRIPGFFPTPPSIAARMLAWLKPSAGAVVLEPSAGNGHIALAIRAAGASPFCIQDQYSLVAVLLKKGFRTLQADFLEYTPGRAERFGFVAMNPPFEHGADIDHLLHAFDHCLIDGGRLAA